MVSPPSNMPDSAVRGGSVEDEASRDTRTDPDPLDALRAELATLDQQPVVDRVARFEHANVVLAAALAELDEV